MPGLGAGPWPPLRACRPALPSTVVWALTPDLCPQLKGSVLHHGEGFVVAVKPVPLLSIRVQLFSVLMCLTFHCCVEMIS